MNILVTGATGFIGLNLIKKLSQNKDYNISCLLRRSSNVKKLSSYKVKLHFADITSENDLDKITEKFDVIFHCAAYVDDKNREKLFKVNVLGTENICKLALRLGAGKLIYISSVAVVSGNPQVPLTENLPYRATNLYGESKIEAEKIAVAYRKAGLSIAIIRPCMVYGEEEPHMMRQILKSIKRRLFPIINGGKNKFHLVYIQNVVDLMIFCLSNDKAFEESLFIADNEVLTVKEVFTIFSQVIGAKPPLVIPKKLTAILCLIPIWGRKIKFFTKDRAYSVERIKSLGFVPAYPAKESLERSARYLMNN